MLVAASLLGAAGGCAGEARDTAAADAPIITVDDFGDTLRLREPSRRVVSLNPVFTELVFALGYGDRLVGRTSWDLYPDAARAVPDLGDGMKPNVEAVLGARPDLVLLYASATNRAAAQQLRAAGVPTLTLRTDHIADLARVAPIIGAALGDRARGVWIADTVRTSLDRVRAMPRPATPRTVFWHIWESPLMTIGSGSYLSELIEVAGGANVFGDLRAPSPQVSLEEVARRDPYGVLAGPNSARTILSSPEWQAVRAVREGRVLVADTTLVGRPGVRMGEAAWHLRTLIMGDSTP